MAKQFSCTKYKNKLLPDFRSSLQQAESVEDVKKAFSSTMRRLLENVLPDASDVDDQDMVLTPENDSSFSISENLQGSEHFRSMWNNSDLSKAVADMAETAINRYKRLKKHPEKTDAKIRM